MLFLMLISFGPAGAATGLVATVDFLEIIQFPVDEKSSPISQLIKGKSTDLPNLLKKF